eukprot:COSAG06_NODE_6223_length_3036_cov_3.014641_3_plen_246_part_00
MAHNDKPKKKAPAEGGTVANSAPAKGLGLPGSTSHYIHQTADAVGMLHASRIIISCICKHNMQTTNRRRGGWWGGGGGGGVLGGGGGGGGGGGVTLVSAGRSSAQCVQCAWVQGWWKRAWVRTQKKLELVCFAALGIASLSTMACAPSRCVHHARVFAEKSSAGISTHIAESADQKKSFEVPVTIAILCAVGSHAALLIGSSCRSSARKLSVSCSRITAHHITSHTATQSAVSSQQSAASGQPGC